MNDKKPIQQRFKELFPGQERYSGDLMGRFLSDNRVILHGSDIIKYIDENKIDELRQVAARGIEIDDLMRDYLVANRIAGAHREL